MSIVNRSLDASEQMEVVYRPLGLDAGTSLESSGAIALFTAPYPCTLKAVHVSAPIPATADAVGALQLRRLVTGAGATVILGVGLTLALANFNSAGVQSFTLATGASLINLQAGDTVEWNISSGGVQNGMAVIRVQPLQDIKSYFGTV